MTNQSNPILRAGIYGALINIAGILLSGPLGLILVMQVHPNPPWETPQLWAENYHPVQTLPFFFGFFLLGGYMMMFAVIHQIAEEKHKALTLTALISTAAFVALIFFNYISQTTFLPALAKVYRPEYDPLITLLSFSNPMSLCWAIEMWGYALLGVSTILVAPVFRRNQIEKMTAGLMVANGVISLAGGFVTAANLSWVMTPAGMANYIGWNVLVLALAVFFALSMYGRMEQRLGVQAFGD